MRPWIGWATAVAFIAGPRCPLDVEDDFGNALLRIDDQSMSGRGLDDELELVALLVDRFSARTTAQRGAFHLHVERSEEEMLGLVDEQEFGEPPEQERGDVFRFEPDFDLSDLFDRVEIRDEAEHPLGGGREQLVQRGPVRADPDVRGVLDLFVPHDGQNTLEDESPPVSGDVEAARWELG